MDGISGVMLMRELPAMVNMSVSLAGRNEKYGKLCIARNRLFNTGVLTVAPSDACSSSVMAPRSSNLSLSVDADVLMMGTGRRISSLCVPSNGRLSSFE